MTQTLSQTAEKQHPSPLREEIGRLGPWFHNLHLPDGTQTCPDHWLGDFPSFKWGQISPHIPQDLSGWSCLDIGCNAGYYTFELARRGATVLGIDLDDRYLHQARWAAKQFGLEHQVRFRNMQVYDLARYDAASDQEWRIGNRQSAVGNCFDLVLFMGVLYHLRYPMLGLDIVCQRVKRLLVFQTLTAPGDDVFPVGDAHGFQDRHLLNEPGWPKMAFLEHHFAGDPTNWWAPNHAACEAMLRAAGMKVVSRPGHEFYLCEPDPARPSAAVTWDAAEFLAATGQSRRR
jgi:tRNA (mo5U34)-methyltransferase